MKVTIEVDIPDKEFCNYIKESNFTGVICKFVKDYGNNDYGCNLFETTLFSHSKKILKCDKCLKQEAHYACDRLHRT